MKLLYEREKEKKHTQQKKMQLFKAVSCFQEFACRQYTGFYDNIDEKIEE